MLGCPLCKFLLLRGALAALLHAHLLSVSHTLLVILASALQHEGHTFATRSVPVLPRLPKSLLCSLIRQDQLFHPLKGSATKAVLQHKKLTCLRCKG